MKQKITTETKPLTQEMKEIVKSLRRGGEICQHSSGVYCFVTESNSKIVGARAVIGLIKRGLLEFDKEILRMTWYTLSDLGRSIKLD